VKKVALKTEVTCDRCGNEISRYYDIKNESAKIQLWPVGEYRTSGGQRIDLCPECYEQFVNFLEGGRR
jgi:hypothetical protein